MLGILCLKGSRECGSVLTFKRRIDLINSVFLCICIPQAMHSVDYYVFTMSRTLSVLLPNAPCQHGLVRRAVESITLTDMQQWRHHMTARGVKLSSSLCLFLLLIMVFAAFWTDVAVSLHNPPLL